MAVVEWTPSGPHLIPVSILVDGKFYDAGLYLANPVPMALEPGNIYEIQKSGDPAGLFTIKSAMELQASNTFYGVGKITSQADVEAANKRAAAAKAAAAARAPSRQSSEDSGPPRLRRAGGAVDVRDRPAVRQQMVRRFRNLRRNRPALRPTAPEATTIPIGPR